MKIVILKLSGKSLNNFINEQKWIDVIHSLKNEYDGLIIIHGGGNKISEWANLIGCEVKFKNGQRITDKKMMEVVTAVQSGLLNTQIVSFLQSNNFDSIGLSGIDRNLFIAEIIDEELGFVGYPQDNGKTNWIYDLLNQNIIPVFSSVCRDKSGNLINVNADVFTESLASALNVDTVLFLSDVEGVKLNNHIKNLIDENEIQLGINSGEIKDGMIPKLQSCLSLIEKGIKKVWIGSDISIPNNKNLFVESGRFYGIYRLMEHPRQFAIGESLVSSQFIRTDGRRLQKSIDSEESTRLGDFVPRRSLWIGLFESLRTLTRVDGETLTVDRLRRVYSSRRLPPETKSTDRTLQESTTDPIRIDNLKGGTWIVKSNTIAV